MRETRSTLRRSAPACRDMPCRAQVQQYRAGRRPALVRNRYHLERHFAPTRLLWRRFLREHVMTPGREISTSGSQASPPDWCPEKRCVAIVRVYR